LNRFARLTPFLVMDVLRKAQSRADVIHFEVGAPDIPPAPAVVEALVKAAQAGHYPYTESLGLWSLRETIAQFYYKRYGVNIAPERVIVTVGSSGALLMLYAILFNAHEQLLLPDPGYPCYKNFAAILDIQPLLVPIDQHCDYQLTVDTIKQYQNIKAIQIASPANPIGNVYPPAALKAIAEYCDDHAIYFISDELYHGLAYETEAQTALAFSDNAIVVNGLSKYFSLPGLRLGWAIVPKNLVRKAEIVMQNVYISAPIISQQAALAAFDDAYLMSVTQMYRQRRDYLYEQLGQLFTIDAKPEGGFYIWANTTPYAEDSLKFSQLLLDEIGVATTAGIDFGKNNTQNYLRFAYTRDVPHLQEGVRRLKQFLKPELLQSD